MSSTSEAGTSSVSESSSTVPSRADECSPIKSLDELLNFRAACHCCIGRSARADAPRPDAPLPANRARVLLCHDFKGGYLLDRHHCSDVTQAFDYCASLDYHFRHWHCVDVFVYFSHNFVTVPPCSWIRQAHDNGVKILGTIIIEWNTNRADELLAPENLDRATQALVDLCLEADFDGWLFNMEVDIDKQQVSKLVSLVAELGRRLKAARPTSLVLWYDSVTTSGKIVYRNELTEDNRPFFDHCDGIFINYGWTDKHLERSETLAGDRARDVYVGVDVFGRNTTYEAGFNSPTVVNDILTKTSCSVAVFAPGWVLECNNPKEFDKNQDIFWGQMPKLKDKSESDTGGMNEETSETR